MIIMIINLLLALGIFTVGFMADRVWQDFIRGEKDNGLRRVNKFAFIEAITATIVLVIVAVK